MGAGFNLGLYSNARRKPYKYLEHAPLIAGAYGMFRNFPNNANYAQAVLLLEATDIDEILAQTALAEVTYDGVTIDCWDAATLTNSGPLGISTEDYSGTYFGGGSSPMVACMQTTSVGAWYNYGKQIAGPATVASGATLSGAVLATVADDGGTNLRLDGLTVVDGGSFGTWNIEIKHNGSTIYTGSTTGVYFNDSSAEKYLGITTAVAGFDLSKVEVIVTNATGSSKSNVKLYLYGSRFGPVNASNPVYLQAGIHTHLFDAPGITSGDLYRTLTCRTAGAGQSRVGWRFRTWNAGMTNTTTVSTGTHHCELDELCNTWID